MEKKFLVLGVILLLLPTILAINIAVEKETVNSVLIEGLKKPAIVELKITNFGDSGEFRFYTFESFNISPRGPIYIQQGKTKSVTLKITPLGDFSYRGVYPFTYYIKGEDGTELEKRIIFKMVKLADAFEINTSKIDPLSEEITIFVKNKENFDFGEVSFNFSSNFFEFSTTEKFRPYESKQFKVKLNKEKFDELAAGYYTLSTIISVDGAEDRKDTLIEFQEEQILKTITKKSGFLISTRYVKKINEGNSPVAQEIIFKKNIFTKLFTVANPSPDNTERHGWQVYYIWNREIQPGESLEISITTNWLLPFVILALIVGLAFVVRVYLVSDLVLRKRVSFVKTKGGEFALKVFLIVKARKSVEKINVIDKIPAFAKVYPRFSGEEPTRVNESARRIEWNFERLEGGEVRTMSYIIYSKIGVSGKFALPRTSAIYEKNGKIKECQSNHVFFISESKSKKI